MNSTLSFSIKKICDDHKHFVFTFENNEEKRVFFFSNASGFERRQECLGMEIEYSELHEFFKKLLGRKGDFSINGDFAYIKIGKYKISFTVYCKFLSGNYVLLNPAWGRNTNNKMWLLIPSNKLK